MVGILLMKNKLLCTTFWHFSSSFPLKNNGWQSLEGEPADVRRRLVCRTRLIYPCSAHCAYPRRDGQAEWA